MRKVQTRWPSCQILAVGVLLWEGWEMDNYVALISQSGKDAGYLVTTHHGTLMECSKDHLSNALLRHTEASKSIRDILKMIGVRPLDILPGSRGIGVSCE